MAGPYDGPHSHCGSMGTFGILLKGGGQDHREPATMGTAGHKMSENEVMNDSYNNSLNFRENISLAG